MTIDFPNPSRSFDPTISCVRFFGYDRTIEISFFVELGALLKLQPKMEPVEADILSVFDMHSEKIYKTAARIYGKGERTRACMLKPENF